MSEVFLGMRVVQPWSVNTGATLKSKLLCLHYLAEGQPRHGNSETCLMPITLGKSLGIKYATRFDHAYMCRLLPFASIHAAISSNLPHSLFSPILRHSRRSQNPSSSVGSVCGIVAEEENVSTHTKMQVRVMSVDLGQYVYYECMRNDVAY